LNTLIKANIDHTQTTDIVNSDYYLNNQSGQQTVINLVTFADGVTFKGGKNGSMVAMLSSIAELPPRLRMASKNLITHFLIGRSNPDLDTFFKENKKEMCAGPKRKNTSSKYKTKCKYFISYLKYFCFTFFNNFYLN
jgi:hypothetical protein